MIECFRLNSRQKLTFVSLVISIGVCFNIMCLYYLNTSPSPWMSHHGPFYMTYNKPLRSCRDIRQSPFPLPKTALVSFPGSGNTWLRHIVQQVTGTATGSVYNDSALLYRGFPAEGTHDSTVSLIKTHDWGEKERSRYSKAVLLIRDPFDCLRAEFNRQRAGHLGHATDRDYTNYWHRFVYENAKGWLLLYLDWLKFDGPIHVIQYNSLQANLVPEIRKLLNFLSLPYTEKDFQCMLTNKDGSFKRNKRTTLLKPVRKYTFYMKQSINNYRLIVTKELDKFYHKWK